MRTAQEVIPLLEYEEDDADGLMTPEFIALRDTMAAGYDECGAGVGIRCLWADEIGPAPEYVHYLFVVDRNGALKGGLSLAQLMLALR